MATIKTPSLTMKRVNQRRFQPEFTSHSHHNKKTTPIANWFPRQLEMSKFLQIEWKPTNKSLRIRGITRESQEAQKQINRNYRDGSIGSTQACIPTPIATSIYVVGHQPSSSAHGALITKNPSSLVLKLDDECRIDLLPRHNKLPMNLAI